MATKDHSDTISDGDSFAKGHELVTVLMCNVRDLETLYQLVATCSAAKKTFERWPIHHFNCAIASLPDDLRQLALAYIASSHLSLGQDPNTLYVNSLPDLPLEDEEDYMDEDWLYGADNRRLSCSKRQSLYTRFLDDYLGGQPINLPERLTDPLAILKRISGVYKAVETLTKADIWQSARTSYIGQQAPTDQRSVRRALWRFQMFSTLYWDWEETNTLDFSREGCPGKWRSDKRTMNRDQRRFFHKMGFEGTLEIAKAYDDLRAMLTHIYASDLACIFEDYLSEYEDWVCSSSRPGCNFDDSLKESLVAETEEEFNGYLDYRLSLGLPYLSVMYRTKSPLIVPIDRFIAKKANWTQQFLTQAVTEHVCTGFEWCRYYNNPPWDNAYELQSMGTTKLQSPEEYHDVHKKGWTVDRWHLPGYKLQIVLGNDRFALRKRLVSIEHAILEGRSLDHDFLGGIPESSVPDRLMQFCGFLPGAARS